MCIPYYRRGLIKLHDPPFYVLLIPSTQKELHAFAVREKEKLYTRLEKGEESETPGLFEQWLREGKLTEEEAFVEASTVFGAAVDTVNSKIAMHTSLNITFLSADSKPECVSSSRRG